jgi:hypothetical protein
MPKKALVYFPLALALIFNFSQPALAAILLTQDGRLVYQADQILGEQTDSSHIPVKAVPVPDRRPLPLPAKGTGKEPNRIRLETAGEKLKVQFQSPTGREETIDTETVMEIAPKEPGEAENRTQITPGQRKEEMMINRNQVRARTNFPLAVDPATNELVITAPAGEKRITVLPDQAIKNLTERGVIDRVDPLVNELNLVETDGRPVYEVEGEIDKKLFGFMPVKIRSKIKVSAETGDVVRTETTLRNRLFKLFSF